jgi:pimeloyl-ACP methyl ester carboxylesterase
MIQRGSGPPLVLIPGVQGRWEWLTPAVDALANHFRVITFSYPGEPGSNLPHDPQAGFEALIRQVDLALDHAGCDKAVMCGVSFGGLVAAIYAARRAERTTKLVLVSAIGPGWQIDERAQAVLSASRWTAPMFVPGSLMRLYPEMAVAMPAFRTRVPFLARQAARVFVAPVSLSRTADRVRLAATLDAASVCGQIAAPTLVVTGEPGLDRVVPVEGTRRYVGAIKNARHVTLERTGHIGAVTQPERFARLVADFVREDAA